MFKIMQFEARRDSNLSLVSFPPTGGRQHGAESVNYTRSQGLSMSPYRASSSVMLACLEPGCMVLF